ELTVLPRCLHELDDGAQPALEHRLVQRLLARKMVVEARRRELQLAGEIADGHAVDAMRGEQALGRVEDRLPSRKGRRRLRGRGPPGPCCLAAHRVAISTEMNVRSSRPIVCYRTQRGGRFSTKAWNPSRTSSDASESTNIGRSRAGSCRLRSRFKAVPGPGPGV